VGLPDALPLGELTPDLGDVCQAPLTGATVEPELEGERRIAEQRQLLGSIGAGGAETSCHTRIMQRGCDSQRAMTGESSARP
jgi:hypothetical protein